MAFLDTEALVSDVENGSAVFAVISFEIERGSGSAVVDFLSVDGDGVFLSDDFWGVFFLLLLVFSMKEGSRDDKGGGNQ